MKCSLILMMLIFGVSVCLAQGDTDDDYRFWKTVDGKQSLVQLKLISKDAQNVQLRRKDNQRLVSIPIDRLSDSDRQFLLAAASGPTASSTAEDWPCFRGPNRNGISNARLDLLDQPKELWRFEELGTRYHGSAAISNGKLYINGGRVNRAEPLLYCFDATSGELQWKVSGSRTHSTPSVHDGRVYTVGDRCYARCFDATTGELIWKSEELPDSTKHRNYGHAASPLIYKDRLIVNFGGGVALKLTDGTELWRHEGYAGLATPVVFSHRGQPAVAIFGGDKLVARDPESGDQLWSIDREAAYGVNACDPIFIEDDSKVFISSSYADGRALYDISGEQPMELWSMGAGSSYPSGVLVSGKLYGMAGGFGRINLDSGKRESRGPRANSVLVIDGKWIFLSGDGKLEIGTMQSDRFNVAMQAQVLGEQTWNAPAYWQGKLYVRNQEGVLVCLQIGR